MHPSQFFLFQNTELILLLGAVILFFSVFAGKAGNRFGIPALLLFLGIGMLFGSDGLGIQFSSPEIAQFIGILALSIILFSGGMDTRIHEIKPIASPGVVLATVGVLLTTVITGAFIYLLFSVISHYETLSFAEALLLAAIMSSTDSASVFSILRGKKVHLKERLRPTLELESGSNDPMAYMLTLLLISYIQVGGLQWQEAVLSLLVQLVLGGAGGYAMGKVSAKIINRINIGNAALYPILLMAIVFFTFSLVTLCKGNGYLAVYVAGLVIGNTKHIHKRSIATFFDGFTWLCQIVMFLALGLLVNPHELLPIAPIGLAIGVFMIVVARPVSVLCSLLPYKTFSRRARMYISWVGLRGAVPIIFATYPMIAGFEHAGLFFNVVFFITILSLLIQGTTVSSVARWLGVVAPPAHGQTFDFELPEEIKSAMSEVEVSETILLHGNKLMDIELPDHTLVVMVKREGNYFVPKGNTPLQERDMLLLISDNDEALVQAYRALGITDYTLKKN